MIVGALVHPAHGTGLRLCLYMQLFEVECPGCGLTRSVSCAARGMLQQSWTYHPLGILTLVIAAILAAWPLLPATWRMRVGEQAHQRRWLAPVLTLMLAIALVAVMLSRLN